LGGTGCGGNVPVESVSKATSIHMRKLWLNDEFRKASDARRLIQNHNRKGCKHKDSSKFAIGRANSVSQKGERNSRFGTMWIKNDELQQSRKVSKSELETFIQQGWVCGRKMRW
jgi:hypothetical protein